MPLAGSAAMATLVALGVKPSPEQGTGSSVAVEPAVTLSATGEVHVGATGGVIVTVAVTGVLVRPPSSVAVNVNESVVAVLSVLV